MAGYVEAIANGAEFPPVVVFSDGETLWLADGFHRLSAYRFLGLTEIDADVRTGSRDDAMIYAATANVSNGRPMSQKEKREAGERLIELTDWSDREIERKLNLGRSTVTKWRHLSGEISPDTPATRTVTRGGATYEMDTSKIGKRDGNGDGQAVESKTRLIGGSYRLRS